MQSPTLVRTCVVVRMTPLVRHDQEMCILHVQMRINAGPANSSGS